MRSRIYLVAIALGLVAAACGGVSQAEYDQKTTELALTQQDLYEARERIDELDRGTDMERVEEQVLAALGLRGMSVEPGRDRAEALAEAVRATADERDELLIMIEEIGGTELQREVLAPPAELDIGRIDALLVIASTTQDWMRPTTVPASADEIELIRPIVEVVADAGLQAAYDVALGSYDAATTEDRIELLAVIGYQALETARRALAG